MVLHLSFFVIIFFSAMFISAVNAVQPFKQHHGWDFAHATFYNSPDTIMGGACGYGNMYEQGYGEATTALSTALFNNGASCGACFELVCVFDPQWCRRGVIRVTATNFCPPDYSKTKDIWCNPPQKHFDLTQPMFEKIAQYRAGVIPVLYRRVKCWKRGGIKFEIGGNPFWTLVLVYNVGGAGEVASVRVRGSGPSSKWTPMVRNWGQKWQTFEDLRGQSMSFQVTTVDGVMVEENDVVSSDWQIGRSYQGIRNFG